MLQNLVIASILAVSLLAIGTVVEIIPMGNEPIETPWRVTASMVIGLLIGVSAGFSWLQKDHKGGNIEWPVMLAVFVTAGVCALEISHCIESNYVSLYTLPVVLSGPSSIGIVLGAAVRFVK
ncbi:MAG: hypothetical protein HOE54_07205 [Gammaproteobacteria bacterium]|jgi:hypothetical protein|nr:hypothetical protein [Gammaproteobacteria bacterium]